MSLTKKQLEDIKKQKAYKLIQEGISRQVMKETDPSYDPDNLEDIGFGDDGDELDEARAMSDEEVCDAFEDALVYIYEITTGLGKYDLEDAVEEIRRHAKHTLLKTGHLVTRFK